VTTPRGLLRSLVIMVWGTGGSILLGVCQSIAVARLLGPSGLAPYATTIAAVTIAAQLSDGGLANSYAYFGRERPGSLVRLTRLLLRHVGVCLLLATTVMGFAWWFDIAGTRSVLRSVSFAAVLLTLFGVTMAGRVMPVLVLAVGRYRAHALLTNGAAALQLAALLAAYAVAGPSWDVFVAAVAGAQLVAVAVQVMFVLRRHGQARPEAVSLSECYGFGLRIKWAEMMKFLSGRADLLVVASALPARDVGLYSLALGLREFGMTPLRTYSGILQNMLVDRRRAGFDDRILVLGSLMLQAAISTALSVGAVLTFPILLPLVYGAEYRGAAMPAAIALTSTIFLSIAGICWSVFNMRGEPGTTSAIVTVSGLSGPVLVYVLARSLGLNGAALASVASSALAAALSVIWLVRRRGYTARDLPNAAKRLRELLRAVRVGTRTADPEAQAVV
jgi:O-antigen/teichoic acid export membrane protein